MWMMCLSGIFSVDVKYLDRSPSTSLVSSGKIYDFLLMNNILSSVNDQYIRFSLPALDAWPHCPYPIASVLELLGPR